MATSRVSLVRGPSKNSFNGGVCFSAEDYTIRTEHETMPITTSPHGKVDERVINELVEASFTPDGRWNDAFLAAFVTPFANMVAGASLLTAADKPFVASASDGEVHTVAAACVTKLPDIFLSAKKRLFGSLTVSGYRQLAKGWTDANSLYTVAGSGGSIADATFAPSQIITQPYTAAWGAVAGFGGFDTEEGWTISFNLNTKPIETDSQGRLDVTFVSLEVMAKCVPVGPTSAQIQAVLYPASQRGYSLQGSNPDLVITGADGETAVALSAAGIKTAGYRFGAAVLRAGEIGFVATRKFTGGAQQPLFAVGTAATPITSP